MAELRSGNRIISPGGTYTLGHLADIFGAHYPQPSPRLEAPLALVCEDAVDACGAAAWMTRTGVDATILPRERLTEPVRVLLRDAGFVLLFRGGASECDPTGAPCAVAAGRISLLTSGTTGVPKLVPHSWETLYTASRIAELPPRRWLVTYQGGTYAWFQIMTLALFRAGQDLVVADRRDPLSLIETAVEHGVTAISATPTFWRLALLQARQALLRKLRLQQITLGGERVDQVILNRLAQVFPAAHLTHIFATTEAGAAIVVTDGREGFPLGWLAIGADSDPGDHPRLRVHDGILQIRSRHASPGQAEWVDTGDAVEIREDRVLIIGRKSAATVNVGGIKIATRDVEQSLLEDPGVAWCRVYGCEAPLVGALLVAEVVPSRSGTDVAQLESQLTQRLRSILEPEAIPRFWRFLETIPMTGNLKTERANPT